MEKYSKAVSEMYSQFKKEAHPMEKKEPHPMEKYIGRSAIYRGKRLEVVGYSYNELTREPSLIIDASQIGGWRALPTGVIFKECESYWYADINNLID